MRIEEHPILGTYQKGKTVTFTLDGKEMQGCEGEPIAAALKAAGVMVHRHTLKNDAPRGIFCAIGLRTCVTPLHAGMKVQTQYGVSAKE